MITMNIEAPELPSEALVLALRELGIVKRRKRMRINMGVWVARGNNSCAACLAGCIMLRHSTTKRGICPHDYTMAWYKVLHAIDAFRQGGITRGCRGMLPDSKYWPLLDEIRVLNNYIAIPKYSDDPLVFKGAIRNLIKQLQGLGI